MKHHHIFLSFPVLLQFAFSACSLISEKSGPSARLKTDREKAGLNGDVILVVDNNKYTQYDEIGRTLNYWWNDSSNPWYMRREWVYIDDKVSKLITYSAVNLGPEYSSIETEEYFYDKSSKLIKTKSEEGEESYVYSDGKLEYKIKTYVKEPLKLDSICYYYSPTDQIDSIKEYSFENGKFTWLDTYYYLDEIKVKQKMEWYKNGATESAGYIQYSERGEPLKSVHKKRGEDSVVSFNISNYLYDAKGNWISAKDEVDKEEPIRKIFYRGDDISSEINRLMKRHNASFSSKMLQPEHLQEERNRTSDNNNIRKEVKCRRCSGSGQCSTCTKIFKVSYWAGNSRGGWKNENKTFPGQVMCSDCRGAGVNYGRKGFGEDPESKPCYAGCNNGWKYCQECNYGGNGREIGKCQDCKGKGFN